MSAIAIITARGGSKRIPKKNIKDFCGKPIIAYSIETALKSGLFDVVMVSTDSEEIAAIAKSYHASVPFMRSAATSNDYATTADVLEEVISEYKSIGQTFDFLCCIYPTAPFITSEKLQKAVHQLYDSSAYSLMTVVRYSSPPQRSVVIKDGCVQYQYPEYAKTRSQDLEPIYYDCGQFYVCRMDAFQKYRSLITPKTLPFVINEEEVQDIDNPSDWIIAEEKYKAIILHQVG